MDKKKIEILLSKTKEIKKPKIFLEQYTISSSLAAEILNFAYLHRDLKNKIVVDLGCGTGRLAIGSFFYKTKISIGIDIDKEVIKIAKENAKKLKVKVYFLLADIQKINLKNVDTIIQNPPFGTRKKHYDLIFLKKAFEMAKVVYSLHSYSEKSIDFLENFAKRFNFKLDKAIKLKFKIKHSYKFHKKPVKSFDVMLLRFQKFF
ncbi:MAG: RNA methyltransferase [Candidatus Aenigmarchaeota archaeon ex4484_224]|nr:MAG: RNA methyltransferase [Candidatus Aenigmarchaeota archaeon ex4484_224]